jgi:hypothetical protein
MQLPLGEGVEYNNLVTATRFLGATGLFLHGRLLRGGAVKPRRFIEG